jgi:pimeloyl-ACP methyl ester carboxylesterase
MIETRSHAVETRDGWTLSLQQTWDPARLREGRRPVLIVPGYGMNSFIFSYHPRGWSMEGWLVERGFEVFRVDLRAQGDSRYTGAVAEQRDRFRLEDLAITDLGAAIDATLRLTRGGRDRVDVIGASLGGSLAFAHAVLERGHRIGAIVAMGSPVRWVKIHPLLALAFKSPALVGQLRLRGTRRLAELALPQLARFTPWLLSVYMNAAITETAAARDMVRTVEDPNRFVNRQIARWINDRELRLRTRDGRRVNVCEGLGTLDVPLLCVVANGDGIVPVETARWPYEAIASRDRTLLSVGDADVSLAHADLFVSNEAHRRVFEPLSAWLEART